MSVVSFAIVTGNRKVGSIARMKKSYKNNGGKK